MSTQPNYTGLTDEELLQKFSAHKRSKTLSALIIGFCIGIIIWSVTKNTWGFFTLIPMYFIYKSLNNESNHDVLQAELKARGLG